MTYYIRITDGNGVDITQYFTKFVVEEKMDLIRFNAEAKRDLLNIVSVGDIIVLYIDVVNPPSSSRNKYVVSRIQDVRRGDYSDRVRVEGLEAFYDTVVNKVVAEIYQGRQVEGIFSDLIAKYTSWTPQYDETDITINRITFNYIPLYDALKTLMELSGTYLLPDAQENVNLFIKGLRDSGVTYQDRDFRPSINFIQALDNLKNIVYVVGSEDYREDQTQTDTSGGAYQSNQYSYAVSFTPTRSRLRQISLYLEKIGLPPDLTGRIVRDNNGPTGEVVAYFSYNRNYVDVAGWYPIAVDGELTPGQKYWIVVDQIGDASNYYKWYHSTSGEYAYSPDGSTWTLGTGAGAYKTYYGVPVIVKVSDENSIQTYGARELVVRDENIRDRRTARTYANQILSEKSSIRSDFGDIIVYTDNIPRPGELITINSTRFNVNNQYLVKGVKIELMGGRDTYTRVTLKLGMEKEALDQILREIYGELRKIRHKDIDILKTEINKYITVTDQITQTDQITITTGNSGQYQYDDPNTKYGFSDYA